MLSVGVNVAAHFRGGPVDFTCEEGRVSLALGRGEGFSNPFLAGPSGPTAHVAPIYPYLHAALCSVFGTGALGALMVIVLTALVWALHWALVHRFASMHGQTAAGLWAAIFGVLCPLPGRLLKWDSILTATVVVGVAVALGAAMAVRRNGPKDGILPGALMAAGTLLNPSTSAIWAAWACLLCYQLGMRRMARLMAPAAVVFLIPVGAWMARNYGAFGHLFFVRDNAGLELWVSNNDCARPLMSDNINKACYAQQHPNLSHEALRELVAVGEDNFSVMHGKTAAEWIRTHPARFLELTTERFLLFWFPIDPSTKATLLNGAVMCLVTLGSILGAVLWRRGAGFGLLATALAAYSPVYYLVQAEQRYRYPVYWISVLLACAGCRAVLGWARGRGSAEPPRAHVQPAGDVTGQQEEQGG